MIRTPTIETIARTALLVLAGLAALAPAPVAADDCGGSYVACISDAGILGSSEALHEEDCYSEYWSCVHQLFLLH